jgi:putative transposase
MKQSRFTERQIVRVLKAAEAGMAMKELCRQYGVSEATSYNWKAKYGCVSASDLKHLKEFEGENAKLKQMYADLALENDAIRAASNRKP